MSKSSYPNKIDSSVELPVVRNNVTEITAEVINSLRDAIIQIEKTLGVNPNGISTVSDRLSQSIGQDGELKKDSLDKVGVIYGPIFNENIAKTAAIDEQKIRLDFPTKLLQTEISLLKTELDNFTNLISEISSKLSAHINVYAIARHSSENISVPAVDIVPSGTATDGFAGGKLTDILSDIYSNHIGFSGETSQNNKAHNASQIYFDNTNVTDLISSVNIQSAIETLADQKTEALKTNLFATNSSGVIRQSKYFDVVKNVDGKLKLDYSEINYAATSSHIQTISFSSPQVALYDLEKFDILEISSSANESDNKKYLILNFELISGDVSLVTILGGTLSDSSVNSLGRVFKNPYQYSNINAYNTTVRPRYNRTNTPDIIVAHPNAATVITNNIIPENINSTASTVAIEIDGTEYSIPFYQSSRGNTNTLDEIVLNINEYCADNKIPLFAYKIRNISCYEIALSHVIPSWIDSSVNRYLKIKSAPSNDAIISAGLSSYLDIEIYGSYGNSILINGNTISDSENILTFLGSDLSLTIGTNNILFDSIEPILKGIKVGNLCYIEDNGLYRVQSISGNTITLDDQGTTFTSDISSDKRVYFYKGVISLEELEFSEIVGPQGSIMLDLFMTEDLGFGYHIRSKFEGTLTSGSFSGIITDISKDYLLNQTDTISISSSGLATVFDGSATSEGDQIYSSGEYIIRSTSGSSFYKMQVVGSLPLTSAVSVVATGYEELPFNLIHLSRCIYSTAFGFVIGESGSGVPTILDKRPSGTINEVIISPSIIDKYISGPRSELRSEGVASGLGFSTLNETATTCTISINPGFYYNRGTRYKFNGVLDLNITHDGTSFFAAFNSEGCLKIGTEIIDPVSSGLISPFYGESMTYIGYFIVDLSGLITPIDLRKSISFIDKKINQIIVAEESNAGHFTSVKEAVDYARYYKMFNKSTSIPSILIKNGTYIISETILLDFDIQIVGSGPSTILVQGNDLLASGLLGNLNVSNYSNTMFLIGSNISSAEYQSDNLNYGIRVSGLTCRYADDFPSATDSNFNFFFLITQAIDGSTDSLSFKFDNIIFEGSNQMSESTVNSGSLSGVRQIVPIAFGLALDSGTTATTFGNLSVSSCAFNYVGTGWTTIGAIISAPGTYTVSSSNIFGNIIRNASPNILKVTSGDYYIFNTSDNYTMSGATHTMSNISVAANVLFD